MEAHSTVELHITSCAKSLAVVRGAVENIAAICGFGPGDMHSLVLAIDEALANVIKHGYAGREDQPINVKITPTQPGDGRTGIVVEVRDWGRQVDPCTIRGRPLEEVRPGGLGVHIIRSVMDEAEYSCPADGGMLLRMVKYASQQQGEGLPRSQAELSEGT